MERNEAGYIQLLSNVLERGEEREGRNGKTLSIFGPQLRFDLVREDGQLILPLLTTKRVPYRIVLEELKWFAAGRTDNKSLMDKRVRIWQANAEAGPLWPDTDVSVGDLGPLYGFQWRHFGAEYTGCKTFETDYEEEPKNPRTNYDGKGVDQIRWIVDELRRNPGSRRAVMSAWNPVDIPKMTLPPCHVLSQYWIGKEGLHCHLYQRSADIGLGVPFNIASYATLAHVVARCLGIKARELVMSFGDCHVYEGHIEPLKEQITRDIRPFPTIEFDKGDDTSYPDELICGYSGGFSVSGYDPHPTIKMGMVA